MDRTNERKRLKENRRTSEFYKEMTKSLNLTWTDKDFKSMSWHDNFIESITFPVDDLVLTLTINYIMEWIRTYDNEKYYKYKVGLAQLSFYSVLNLNINLSFNDTTCLYIDEILRENSRLCPDQKTLNWDYRIITDQGDITFDSTGFTQTLISNPKISDILN